MVAEDAPGAGPVFRYRKLPLGSSWRVDETYVLVDGQWKDHYRAVDKLGQAVEFLLTANRDVTTARRFFERAIDLHGLPASITIEKSVANAAAVGGLVAGSGVAFERRQSKHLNNIFRQDHQAIKKRTWPMRRLSTLVTAEC